MTHEISLFVFWSTAFRSSAPSRDIEWPTNGGRHPLSTSVAVVMISEYFMARWLMKYSLATRRTGSGDFGVEVAPGEGELSQGC